MPYNKFPAVKVETAGMCLVGFAAINREIETAIRRKNAQTIVIECYQGVFVDDIITNISQHFEKARVIRACEGLKSEGEILKLTHPSVTDDRIFGMMTGLSLDDLFDAGKVSSIKNDVRKKDAITFVVGIGASLLVENPDLYIYADMARWEIQLRMRKNEVANVGLTNYNDPFETQYKRGFFLDWRLCDDLKKKDVSKWDYVLDTNDRTNPKLITAEMFEAGLSQTVSQPFSVVPFFDPGPWGGQWMKEKFDLDPDAPNFAWCFNCVPEENSLMLDFAGVKFETPSINVVFFRTRALLGEKVEQRFGDEFPIRFDFLDTIDGGNLSLQVHPLTEYIQKHFGMPYTQDESYYMLDADPEAVVYLGLKKNVDGDAMIRDLVNAQATGAYFDADKYAEKWPAKKHDHFLIPAGTVHCSGRGCMVLEISATPYIFTFKLWDWGRMGLDGKPRPINIEHGTKVIQWDRQPEWTQENLINRISTVAEGDTWKEEITGLHELEFIETRRHWHTGKVLHETGTGVNVLMLVEGEEAVVESPEKAFEPFHIRYAEAFIIPANVKRYSITPHGKSEGRQIATIKAYLRT
jgi:mannose-6-phosphate isomerase class I